MIKEEELRYERWLALTLMDRDRVEKPNNPAPTLAKIWGGTRWYDKNWKRFKDQNVKKLEKKKTSVNKASLMSALAYALWSLLIASISICMYKVLLYRIYGNGNMEM